MIALHKTTDAERLRALFIEAQASGWWAWAPETFRERVRAAIAIDKAIPPMVYFTNDPRGLGPNFYSAVSRVGMGSAFWREWKDRRTEFPTSHEEALRRGR